MERCSFCLYDCVRGTPCLDEEETEGCSNMADRAEERRRGRRLLGWLILGLLGFCLWTWFIAAHAAEPRSSYATPRKTPGVVKVQPDRHSWNERVIVREKNTGIVRGVCQKDRLAWAEGSLRCRWIED